MVHDEESILRHERELGVDRYASSCDALVSSV